MQAEPNQRGLAGEQRPVIRPTIAVLPFANMSGDPEQEFFVDGLTEDIITGAVTPARALRHFAQLDLRLQGPVRQCCAR